MFYIVVTMLLIISISMALGGLMAILIDQPICEEELRL